jgi:UDP-GlcNAc3NAcA epimerase
VKLGPIVRAMNEHGSISHTVIHTGQHYDENMSATFFDELELPKPDLDLEVGSASHAAQTAAMLTRLETAFESDSPDAVLVFGDTNSTLAATLAAAKIHVPVAHVEAGLRSFDRTMPEEVNRLVADHCADRLYAPTPQAMANLENENLLDRSVLSGDVMLDAVLHNISLASDKSTILARLGLEPGSFGLVTVHRPVNTTGSELQKLLAALEETARIHLPLVFPVHPRTRVVLNQIDFEPPDNLILLDPIPYLDSISMIQAAAVAITDSGGIQKEAAFLSTPCLTMRAATEWTETVDIGVNRLVENSTDDLVEAVNKVLKLPDMFNEETLRSIQRHYGSGNAADQIISDCIAWLS